MAPLSPVEFATKWQGSTRTERAASQEHFRDLCRMLEVKTPHEADPIDFYAFEKGLEKTGGGDGFADVWKKATSPESTRASTRISTPPAWRLPLSAASVRGGGDAGAHTRRPA